jgi:hypothetical protein
VSNQGSSSCQAERGGLGCLADDAGDDVRLGQHEEVGGALDLGDLGTGALVRELGARTRAHLVALVLCDHRRAGWHPDATINEREDS